MRQLLFLGLLACFVAYASCEGFSLVWNLNDFYELCPGDEFDYNGLNVNSFVRSRGEFYLDSIRTYALEEDSKDYYELFNELDAKQLEEIKSTYHRHLVEMYGKEYLNDPHYNLENLMYQRFTAIQKNLTTFKGKAKGSNPFKANQLLSLQNQTVEEAKKLSVVLNSSKSDKPVPKFFNLAVLYLHLCSLKGNSDENTTMAFLLDEANIIPDKRVYTFNHYEPRRASNDWRRDWGEVHFNMHIPFEQHHSKWVNKTRPCVEAKELPPFYKLKGKVYN